MRRPVSVARRARSWACAALLLAWCAACDLDPIAKHDLCSGPGTISANCKQCQTEPYAVNCPQCVDDPDNLQCDKTPPTGVNMTMGTTGGDTATTTGTPTGGDDSQNPTPHGQSGTSGKGNNPPPGSPNSGTSGAGMSGGPNDGGQPPSGGSTPPPSGGTAADSGTPLAPGECRTDGDCGGDTPACNMASFHCVGCITNAHCHDGKVCDTGAAQCVECTVPDGCGPDMVCYVAQRHCVQCMDDGNCTSDPVNGTCSRLNQCVDCEEGHGCAAPLPVCNGNTCVECTGDTSCSGEKHRCTTDNRCVECLARDGDCNVAGKPVCIVEEQRCVQCIADGDCGDPAASHCNGSNACVGCTADSQCTHLSATPFCDTGSHQCVECKKNVGCGPNSCIPSTHSCSDVPRNSLTACESCQSDEQCNYGYCVPMMFSGRVLGNYCLDPQARVASGDCQVHKPYSRTLTNAPTIDGDAATVCAPPTSTTCAAVLDATNSKSCSSASQCGIGMGLIDSTCLTSIGRCSYVCTADHDCPVSLGTCGQGQQCSLPGN